MAKDLDAPRRGVPHPPARGRRPVHVRRRRRADAEGPRGRPGGRRPRAGRDRRQRRRAPRDPRPPRHHREDGAGWLGFFRDLTARGLTGVKLVTSDAHAGLVAAIAATLPGAAWQRCRTHYAANLMSATPKSSLGLGQSAAALRLRPARRRGGARPVRPGPRRPGREAARRRRRTSTPPAPTSSPSPRSRRRSGGRSGRTTPTNGSTARSAAAPTSSGSSPTATSIIRLVGAVLAEQHDEWAEGRRYLGLDVLARSHKPSTPPPRR